MRIAARPCHRKPCRRYAFISGHFIYYIARADEHFGRRFPQHGLHVERGAGRAISFHDIGTMPPFHAALSPSVARERWPRRKLLYANTSNMMSQTCAYCWPLLPPPAAAKHVGILKNASITCSPMPEHAHYADASSTGFCGRDKSFAQHTRVIHHECRLFLMPRRVSRNTDD